MGGAGKRQCRFACGTGAELTHSLATPSFCLLLLAALAAAAMFLALRWRKRRGLADKAAAPLQQVVPGVDPLALSLLEADASALPAGAVAALHDSQSIR